MNALEQYRLELKTLPLGEHEFNFVLDDEYFKAIGSEEITKGDVNATITVTKIALKSH